VPQEVTALNKKERALLDRIAKRDGVSIEEAASRMVSEAIAKRVRRKSGKGPAKVYGIGRK
jgi:predicted kinase